MICEPCKAGGRNLFHECASPSTCPCQHRIVKRMDDGTHSPLTPRDELLAPRDANSAA